MTSDLERENSQFKPDYLCRKKMVLDASLLNTQHYKVKTKGKVEQ